MSPEIAALKGRAESYKLLYKTNQVGRDEALSNIQPYIDAVNTKATALAKKFNVRPKLITVTGFLR
ncbi:hypothetical protein NSS79_20635 [Paenibacillus sp. FSL L8-0436]|uniref:hypothetical protein n=1 Tax=Paenibacillus sp. FSL L8-0436 TaxID=2954686 RepID=UPI0031593245